MTQLDCLNVLNSISRRKKNGYKLENGEKQDCLEVSPILFVRRQGLNIVPGGVQNLSAQKGHQISPKFIILLPKIMGYFHYLEIHRNIMCYRNIF